MIKNIEKLVFAGGWEQLQHGHTTANITTLPDERESFFIRPDGSTIFTLDSNGVVDANTLDSFWDIASIGGVIGTFDVTPTIGSPSGLAFKDDGTRMYVMNRTPNTIFQFTLVTPWDINSIVAAPVSLDISFISGDVVQCIFSTEGDFLFITNFDKITRLPLPTFWDVTSFVPSTDTEFEPVHPVESAMFKTEGDMMYLLDLAANKVVEYTLSPIWDVTTATLTGNEVTFPPTDEDVLDISIRTNGLEFFASDPVKRTIRKFHLDVLWDISTAAYFPNDNLTTTNSPASITWKPDGTKYFTLNGIFPDNIEEFAVPVPFNTDNRVSNGTFDISALETNPRGMYWKLDGLLCWITGTGSDDIHQLDVATPWDITTMSDPGISRTPIGTGAAPQALVFGDNGFRVYVVDTGDDIMEYTIAVPYDITTMTVAPLTTIDIEPNTPNPRDLVFKTDGSMVFIISSTNNSVTRYTLPTPWRITGLTFVDSLDLAFLGGSNPQGLFIRQDDGKKLFLLDGTLDRIFTFDLDLAFNNSITTTLGEEIVTPAGENIVYA